LNNKVLLRKLYKLQTCDSIFYFLERVRICQPMAQGLRGHREGRPGGRDRGEVLPGGDPKKRSQRKKGKRIRVGAKAFRIGEFNSQSYNLL